MFVYAALGRATDKRLWNWKGVCALSARPSVSPDKELPAQRWSSFDAFLFSPALLRVCCESCSACPEGSLVRRRQEGAQVTQCLGTLGRPRVGK